MAQFNRERDNLARLQEQILRQYKRLSFGQYSHRYDFVPTPYSPLPEDTPQDLQQIFNKCFTLSQCPCFEAITFAVMQYIFSCGQGQQQAMLGKIRNLICDENFLFGSGTIKGLLVKGLHRMNEKQRELGIPVANWLKEIDGLDAFSEFWKELIQLQSEGQVQPFSPNPDPIYFQHIANFLGLGFVLRTQHQDLPKQLTITPIQFPQKGPFCTMIIKQISYKQGATEEIEYSILVEKERIKASENLEAILTPEGIVANERKEELLRLKAKSWEVKQKGRELLREFKEFYNSISNV